MWKTSVRNKQVLVKLEQRVEWGCQHLNSEVCLEEASQ